jgi:hypothetical protein
MRRPKLRQGVGDFNGDDAVDILWRDTNSGALSIWFTNGTQVTSGAAVGTLLSNWSVAQVGDYNGDGKSDILLLDNVGDLAVWEMNGHGVVVACHQQYRDNVAGAEHQCQLGGGFALCRRKSGDPRSHDRGGLFPESPFGDLRCGNKRVKAATMLRACCVEQRGG